MRYTILTGTVKLNLKKTAAEVRETAQAMIEFAEKLEEIDRKYREESEEEE